MSWLERLAEEKIQSAMKRGEFDHLPLAGKPLNLETNGFVPTELRLAYKMLKDAGYLPPEMELRKEIITLKELLETVTDEDERYRLVRDINRRVLRLNLMMKRSFNSEDRQLYARKIRGAGSR